MELTLIALLLTPARADDGDDIERFSVDVRRLDERRARDLEERNRTRHESETARNRLARARAADRDLAREIEQTEAEIARGERFQEERARIATLIASTHQRYSREPRNEELYEELQRLRTLHGQVSAEASSYASRRDELRSRLEDALRRRQENQDRIGEASEAVEAARAAEDRAQEAFEESDRALNEFVSRDPLLQEFFEATKRVEPIALELFDELMDSFGEQEPGTSRTIELAIEGEVEIGKLLKGKAGGKYRALLTRDEHGDFELTVIEELSAGVAAGGKLGKLAEVGAEAGLVTRSRQVYSFDRERTGEMMALATLLGAAGMPVSEALRLVDDEIYSIGVGALTSSVVASADVAESGSSLFADLVDSARSWVPPMMKPPGADQVAGFVAGTARTTAKGAADVQEMGQDTHDAALAIKYASSMHPPSDQMSKTVLEGGGRGKAGFKAFSLGKLEREIELAGGVEQRREGNALRDVHVVSMQAKSSSQVRAGVAAQSEDSAKTMLKYVYDQEGNLIGAEIVFKEAREAGAGLGNGLKGVGATVALGSRTLHEIHVKHPDEEQIAYIEKVLLSDARGLLDPERARELLRGGFMATGAADQFSEVVRTTTTEAAQLDHGLVQGKFKVKGTKMDTRSTVLTGDPDLLANSHELGDDHDG